jgi:hypothetical protein
MPEKEEEEVEFIQQNLGENRTVERVPSASNLPLNESNSDVIMNDSALFADENESDVNGQDEEEVELIQTIADYRPVEKLASSIVETGGTALDESNTDMVVLNESAVSEANTDKETDEGKSIQVKSVESREAVEVEKTQTVPASATPAVPVVPFSLNDSNSDVVILNDSL